MYIYGKHGAVIPGKEGYEFHVIVWKLQCNAMQCNAIQYNTIQYNTTSFISNIEHNNITPTICSTLEWLERGRTEE